MSNAGAAQVPEVAGQVGVQFGGASFADQWLAGLEDAAPIGRAQSGAGAGGGGAGAADPVGARRAKTAQYLALRAKIVLACAEGGTNRQAAADLGVDESTVDRCRARFIPCVLPFALR